MNYLEQYKEKGVVVIPNVFTPEECAEIKRQAYLVQDSDIKNAGYPHQPSEIAYNKKSLIFFPAISGQMKGLLRWCESL
jgi:hypothetical protein